MTHEPASPRPYYMAFAALIALTATTVGVAYLDLGAFNAPLALLIAGIKTVLVAIFFMHLSQADTPIAISVTAGIMLFLIMSVFTVADILARAA